MTRNLKCWCRAIEESFATAWLARENELPQQFSLIAEELESLIRLRSENTTLDSNAVVLSVITDFAPMAWCGSTIQAKFSLYRAYFFDLRGCEGSDANRERNYTKKNKLTHLGDANRICVGDWNSRITSYVKPV